MTGSVCFIFDTRFRQDLVLALYNGRIPALAGISSKSLSERAIRSQEVFNDKDRKQKKEKRRVNVSDEIGF